jgi:hypothetical protein
VNGTTPLVAAVRSKRCDIVLVRALLAGAAADTRPAGELPLFVSSIVSTYGKRQSETVVLFKKAPRVFVKCGPAARAPACV